MAGAFARTDAGRPHKRLRTPPRFPSARKLASAVVRGAATSHMTRISTIAVTKGHYRSRVGVLVASALGGACIFCSLVRSAAGDTSSSAAGVVVSHEALTGSTPPSDFQPTFVGALLSEQTDGSWSYHCSGTLVSPTVVVTAAHCLLPSRAYATKLGFTTQNDIGEPPQPSARALDVLIHEQFAAGATADGQNLHDIGLLRLDHDLSGAIASLEDIGFLIEKTI